MLTPVISSHGIFNMRHGLSSYSLELASHGCIVYCLDHTDKSCIGYLDEQNSEFIEAEEFSPDTHNGTQVDFRRNQFEIRRQDIGRLLAFIKDKYQGEEWNINFEKLIAIGHSFGAMTVIEACKFYSDDFKI